jgi:serine/threonine protein kinase
MATLTGRTLGGFLIEEELGRGAMGVVFKARQLSMDRPVALKFLPQQLAMNEKIVARFQREARAAGQLSHPNIVGVFDVGIIDGLHYIAMDLVNGVSVHKRVKEKGPLSEHETLSIAAQIAEALKMAHSRGILHRDIKPDNFLIDDDRVRLADLGLARFMNDSSSGSKDAELTQDGAVMGTPHYMSPEQCKGMDVDHRSDLYSLGASMYVMATNKTPYDGPTATATMVKVLMEKPAPLKAAGPHLSPGFVAMVEKMMAKDPARRFQSAQDVLDAIAQCQGGVYKAGTARHSRVTTGRALPPVVAPPTPVTASPMRPLLLGAGAALLALIVVVVAIRKKNPDNELPVAEKDSGTSISKVDPPPVAPQPQPQPLPPPVNQTPPDPRDPRAPRPPRPPFNDDERDDPREAGGRREFRQLRDELPVLMRRNPAQAIERLEALRTRFPHSRMAGAIADDLKEARAAQHELIKEWSDIAASAKRDAASGQFGKTFKSLLKFRQEHEGTPQAADATKLLNGVVGEVRGKARQFADDNKLAEGQRMLSDAVAVLPADLEGPLVAEQKALNERQRGIAAAVESENKTVADIREKALAAAREPNSAGERFHFADAARLCEKGVAQASSDANKNELSALQQIYSCAASGLGKIRSHISQSPEKITLKTFGKFNDTLLESWSSGGVVFKPQGMPSQTLRPKAMTSEHLLQIADASKAAKALDAREHGAIAFACGAEAMARQSLGEAVSALPAFKPTVENAFKNFKCDESAKPEDAKTADAKPDDTKKTVESKDAPKKEPGKEEKAASVAELKKLGWTVKGDDWLQDPKKKTTFSVKDGELRSEDGNEIRASFLFPDDKTRVEMFVRFETPEIRRARQLFDKMLDHLRIEAGPGYGVQVENNEVTIFGAKVATTPRDEKIPVPAKLDKFPLPAGPLTLSVAVGEKSLVIWVNQKKFQYGEKIRAEGSIRITVEGSAKIDSPTVKK